MARALLELASSAHGDFGASIRHLVQFDAELLRVERVTFWSIGEDTSSLRCEAGYVVSSRLFERGATLLEADHPAYFEALRHARLLSIEDVEGDLRTRELRGYSAVRGIASTLNVAVWVDGRLAGVLCHEHVGPRRRWTPPEEDFAMGAAQVVASTLAARAQTHAETAARRAAFLDDVSRHILPSLDARDVARRAVDLVVPKFADCAVVWGTDALGALELLASTHVDPAARHLVAEGARSAVGNPRPVGLKYVVGQGQSMLVADVTPSLLASFTDEQAARLSKLGIRTMMTVPLSTAGRPASGAMSFLATDRHYRSEDLALAEEVGRRVGAGLENARLYETARQAILARDEFLMLAAHELRTPLTSLQLLAEHPARRSEHGKDTSGARSVAIARQVRRLGALVEHMLDAAHIRGEGIVLTLESFDLAHLVEVRVDSLAERAGRVGSPIAVRVGHLIVGRWDRARLAQLVDHLLDNAIKFGAGKDVEVGLVSDGSEAVLTVRDHGPGIPDDRRASLFSPFERAAPKEHFGGLGLGLYIARAIAVAHGGSIEVSTRVGHGTAFVVRLPLSSS
jgi:signal transduction histidine kinase